MNLIMTELLVSLIGIPVDALASAQGGWNMGATLCRTVGFLLTTLGEFCAHFIRKRRYKHGQKLEIILSLESSLPYLIIIWFLIEGISRTEIKHREWSLLRLYIRANVDPSSVSDQLRRLS